MPAGVPLVGPAVDVVAGTRGDCEESVRDGLGHVGGIPGAGALFLGDMDDETEPGTEDVPVTLVTLGDEDVPVCEDGSCAL